MPPPPDWQPLDEHPVVTDLEDVWTAVAVKLRHARSQTVANGTH